MDVSVAYRDYLDQPFRPSPKRRVEEEHVHISVLEGFNSAGACWILDILRQQRRMAEISHAILGHALGNGRIADYQTRPIGYLGRHHGRRLLRRDVEGEVHLV